MYWLTIWPVVKKKALESVNAVMKKYCLAKEKRWTRCYSRRFDPNMSHLRVNNRVLSWFLSEFLTLLHRWYHTLIRNCDRNFLICWFAYSIKWLTTWLVSCWKCLLGAWPHVSNWILYSRCCDQGNISLVHIHRVSILSPNYLTQAALVFREPVQPFWEG